MFLLRLLSRLPLGVLYVISDLLFPLVYYVVRYRRGVVRENLRNSFPERSEKERRRIERRFYRFFCDYAVETVKMITMSREEMLRRMHFEDTDLMDKAVETHPFCFLMLGHFGNWEWISSIAMSCQTPTSQLYTPLHNRAMDRLFYEMRSRFGGENISKYDALRRILAWKREGRRTLVGFIADQSPKPGSTHAWMDFLHQDTPLFTGAERIGKKVDAAACFACVTRPRRGYYVCRIEPLVDDMRALPDYEVTERYMRRLEQEIEAQPHLWLWTHRRWKHKRPATEA